MSSQKALFFGAFGLLILACSFQIHYLATLSIAKNPSVASTDLRTEHVLEFQTINGLPFTPLDIPTETKSVVLMYFDPSCTECQDMFGKIKKHYSEFEEVSLYLITEAGREQAASFATSEKLSGYPNISILLDERQIMFRTYGLVSTPSFVVFDSDMNLVKVIDDHFNFSIVVKYVREAIKKHRQQDN